MPSLPVRGFGDDGLLVTGGVGASAAVVGNRIVVRGTLQAVTGEAVLLAAAASLPIPASGAGYRPLPYSIAVVGVLQAVIGEATVTVDASAVLEAYWMLDEDLFLVAA